jgi:hypothetical protein
VAGHGEYEKELGQNLVINLAIIRAVLEAYMLNDSEKYVLQFPVPDGARMKDNGLSYFESQAREMAAKKGCILVGMNNVKLDFVRGRWTVSGTAILDRLQATG